MREYFRISGFALVRCCQVCTLFMAASCIVEAEDPIQFNRDIRPILSDKCYFCHGPDKNKREADLRLDTFEGLHGTDGETGALVAGKPDASRMYHRMTTSDPGEKMPPPESGKSLTPQELHLLRRWIEEGGGFEGHWAFLPRVRSSALSPVQGHAVSDLEATARLDALVAATREKHQLRAAPEADKLTLIRRLHFDLIGLPPSEQDVEAFVQDDSPGAYEALVDRLLASPHFGERMAIWWLDLVRYADSVGYHGDQEVSVSPFRQYVIDAFNQNKPFDQFTIEQLAGDLLPSPSREQLIASGYNRLGMMSAEGGVQDKEYLAKYMAERVRNASGTWLGITLGCAECHDHKFDPLTTRDFYRFGAFFADIKERGLYSGANSDGNWGSFLKVPTAAEEAERQSLDARIAQVRSELDQQTSELDLAQREWESQRVGWITLIPEALTSVEGVTLRLQADGSILASGKNPGTDVYTLVVRELPAGITAFRLEVLPDDSLPKRGPGRAGNGNLVLTEFVVQHQQPEAETRTVTLQHPSATYEQVGAAGGNPYGKWAVEAAIDGDSKGRGWGWAIMEQVGLPHSAVFETKDALSVGPGDRLAISLWQNHENSQHTIGRFRISVTTAPQPVHAHGLIPMAIEEILRKASENRTQEEMDQLSVHYRSIAPLLEPQRKELAELEKRRSALESQITSTLITEAATPRMVRVLGRGNWMDESGEEVTPDFPEVFAAQRPADRRLNRLDLAHWVVDPNHPLTSRVLANRLWKLYFGAGLSRKLDDLGAQGDWPTHPQLLEELAQWLVDTNWDIKRWSKLVLMSQTYRLSSQASKETRDLDPYNRYLASQSRFRLDAEVVRDNALAISGLLVTKLGGKSVRPYQPPGYWAYLNFPQREWQNGQGEELYRRGLYTHWQRQYLHPSLLVFDAPSREECTADRPRSNTPLQSLVLLNDPIYVEAARTFAELIAQREGDDVAKLEYAFRRTLSRAPQPKEMDVLVQLLESHRHEYAAHRESANELLSVGARPVPKDMDAVELAAWTSVARVLLNLHETITRY
jgi:hypothetical protein